MYKCFKVHNYSIEFVTNTLHSITPINFSKYQDSCLSLADEINETIRCDENEDWRPIIFNTDGNSRDFVLDLIYVVV